MQNKLKQRNHKYYNSLVITFAWFYYKVLKVVLLLIVVQKMTTKSYNIIYKKNKNKKHIYIYIYIYSSS